MGKSVSLHIYICIIDMKAILKPFLLLPLFLTACSTTSLIVTNPVIDADAPDPTVIRVGNTYYAASTSGNHAQA